MSLDVDTAQKGRSVSEQTHYVISVGTLKFRAYLNMYSNFTMRNYFSYTNNVVVAVDSHLVGVGFESCNTERKLSRL